MFTLFKLYLLMYDNLSIVHFLDYGHRRTVK
jgi:hypothetical protein